MPEGQQSAPDGARVFVVDDDPGIRALLRDVLEDAGYYVREATNGQAALSTLADSEQPTVVLVDQNMPQLTGAVVAAHIAQDAYLAPRCACILLTGRPDGFIRAEDLPLIVKPFDADTLLAAVSMAASR